MARASAVAALESAAASPHVRLTQLITETFQFLRDDELLRILMHEPAGHRDVVAWLGLAEVQNRMGQHDNAFKSLDATSRRMPDGTVTSHARRRMSLLLQALMGLGEKSQAMKMCRTVIANQNQSATDLTKLADSLMNAGAQTNPTDLIDLLLSAAAQRDGLSPGQQANILWRNALSQTGERRRELMFTALELQVGADQHQRMKQFLERELSRQFGNSDDNVAADFAARAESDQLRVALLLRQTELTSERAEAADIYWRLWTSGELPRERMASAANVLVAAQRPGDAISILEKLLHSRTTLREKEVESLRAAFEAAGRTTDVERLVSDWTELARMTKHAQRTNPPRTRGQRGGGFF